MESHRGLSVDKTGGLSNEVLNSTVWRCCVSNSLMPSATAVTTSSFAALVSA